MTTKKVPSDLVEGSSKAASSDRELGALPGTPLFGSSLRTEILVLVAALERTYPRELARLVDRPISMVQKIVAGFERSGILASRLIGNVREVSLNPDFVVAKELKSLLSSLLEREPRYGQRLLRAARRRPRRSGKTL
jgi:hypothetical protein